LAFGWADELAAGHFSWLATRRSKVKANSRALWATGQPGKSRTYTTQHTHYVGVYGGRCPLPVAGDCASCPAASCQLPVASLLLAHNTDATSFLAN